MKIGIQLIIILGTSEVLFKAIKLLMLSNPKGYVVVSNFYNGKFLLLIKLLPIIPKN